MRTKSTSSSIDITARQALIAVLGAEKNNNDNSRIPVVRVVKAKSVKPEPRVCRPGGETKMLTKSRTHQMKEMARKRTVRPRAKRTVHRL